MMDDDDAGPSTYAGGDDGAGPSTYASAGPSTYAGDSDSRVLEALRLADGGLTLGNGLEEVLAHPHVRDDLPPGTTTSDLVNMLRQAGLLIGLRKVQEAQAQAQAQDPYMGMYGNLAETRSGRTRVVPQHVPRPRATPRKTVPRKTTPRKTAPRKIAPRKATPEADAYQGMRANVAFTRSGRARIGPKR